jgi:AcrR family transcriptional regulator
MARGFTMREKEVIRLKLITEGKRLFGKYGLQKTNIAQLTKAADISPATFYKFFDSKEELYFHIFEEEMYNIQSMLLEKAMIHDEESGASAIQNMLMTGMELSKKDPFLEQLFSGHNLNQMLQTRSKDEIDAHISNDYKQFAPVIEHLQEKGKVISVDPKILTIIIQLFFLLHEHRNKFDPEIFDQATQLLANWISQGFTKEDSKDKGVETHG